MAAKEVMELLDAYYLNTSQSSIYVWYHTLVGVGYLLCSCAVAMILPRLDVIPALAQSCTRSLLYRSIGGSRYSSWNQEGRMPHPSTK
eukprot:scaffold118_cov185-Amphora_coffeaeformis.AAC.6